MAKLGMTYVADDLPKSDRDFSPVPDGWYDVTITESEVKDTKAGDGNYIKLRYDITGPSHAGRVIFGNLNLRNKNPKAEEIGAQQLGELMRAVGLARLEDSDQLIGKRLTVKLTTQKSEQYGDKNEVKGFRSNGAQSSSLTSSASASVAASKPPWAK
jgi:hypothetical protein